MNMTFIVDYGLGGSFYIFLTKVNEWSHEFDRHCNFALDIIQKPIKFQFAIPLLIIAFPLDSNRSNAYEESAKSSYSIRCQSRRYNIATSWWYVLWLSTKRNGRVHCRNRGPLFLLSSFPLPRLIQIIILLVEFPPLVVFWCIGWTHTPLFSCL